MDETQKMTELRWQAINNPYYRYILGTGEKLQIALMSLRRGEETGIDIHPDSEVMLVNVSGNGVIVLDGVETEFAEHDWLLVKPGVQHNLINVGKEPLKLIALLTPPLFPANTRQKRRPAKKPI